MSITAETAKAHANDPAVLCCRAEGGITIEPANLEDPAIFDELVDSGLLNLDGCLKIGQVLGAKLTKTSDSLCPLTADFLYLFFNFTFLLSGMLYDRLRRFFHFS